MGYCILEKKSNLVTIDMSMKFQDHVDKRVMELRQRERELKKGSRTIKDQRIHL